MFKCGVREIALHWVAIVFIATIFGNKRTQAAGTVGTDYQWQERTGAVNPTTDCSRANNPACRFYTTVVSVNSDTVVVFGGLAESYFVNSVFNDVWSFSFSTGSWTLLSTNDCSDYSKPACRCAGGGMVYNNKLIITAGEDLSTNPAFPYADTWEFNFATKTWTMTDGGSLWLKYGPEPAEFGYVTLNNKMYIFGGRVQYTNPNSGFDSGIYPCGIFGDFADGLDFFLVPSYTLYVNRNHVYMYDPASRNLTQLYAVNSGLGSPRTLDCNIVGPPCLRGPGFTGNGNFLYVTTGQAFDLTVTGPVNNRSGSISNPTHNDLWQFNILTKTWTKLLSSNCASSVIPSCRQGASLLFRNNSLVMFGGVVELPDWHPVNDIWEYTPGTGGGWKLITNPLDCDYTRSPLCTFWFSAVMINRTLTMFGGNNFQLGTKISLNQVWTYRHLPTTQPWMGAPITSPPAFTGPTGGGSTFTINGQYFGFNASALSVLIDGSPCASLILNIPDNQIICKAPAGGGRAAPAVVVVQEAGMWSSTPIPYFSYFAPNITLITRVNISTDGSSWLTITGTNFGVAKNNPVVYFGDNSCTNTVYSTATQMLCQIPPGVGRGFPVVVNVVDQNSTVGTGQVLNYDPPVITQLNFAGSAPTAGGGSLTVMGVNIGNGFQDDVSVYIGAHVCQITTWLSSNNLICGVPAGSGANKNVSILTGGQSTSKLNAFSYDPPVIYSIYPTVFRVNEQVILTITGNNFGPTVDDVVVFVGDLGCSVLVMTVPHTTLVCTIPQIQPIGNLQISVTADGQEVSSGPTAQVNNPPLADSFVNAAAALAIFCFIIILATFITLILNRNTFTIKSASIPFLITCLVGSGILAGSIFRLDKIDSSPINHDECFTEYWLIACGFSILYGAMLMKNWRMLIIFREQKLQVRLIRDVYLFLALFVLLLIDNALMLVYFYRANTCGSPGTPEATFAIAIIVGIKVIMVLFGVWVAYQSRIIDIEEFNERHQLAYEFYNVFVVLVFIVPVTLILQTDASLSFLFRLLALVMMSAGSVLILFMPKFLEILRNDGGQTPFNKAGSSRNLQRSRDKRTNAGGAAGGGGGGGSRTQGGGTQNFSELTVEDENNDSRGVRDRPDTRGAKDDRKSNSKPSRDKDYDMQVEG